MFVKSFQILLLSPLITCPLHAATMVSGNSLTSSLIEGTPNPPPAVNTTNSSSSYIVTGTGTVWDITPSGPDFTATASTGSITGESTGGQAGNPTGSNVTSSITFTLGVGEIATYDFDLTYLLQADSSAGDPTIEWSLVNTTTSTTIFTASDTAPGSIGASPISIPTLTGTLNTAGDYELRIIGSLTAAATGNNKEAEATFQSINFSVDSAIPEPSAALLSALGFLFLGQYRQRN